MHLVSSCSPMLLALDSEVSTVNVHLFCKFLFRTRCILSVLASGSSADNMGLQDETRHTHSVWSDGRSWLSAVCHMTCVINRTCQPCMNRCGLQGCQLAKHGNCTQACRNCRQDAHELTATALAVAHARSKTLQPAANLAAQNSTPVNPKPPHTTGVPDPTAAQPMPGHKSDKLVNTNPNGGLAAAATSKPSISPKPVLRPASDAAVEAALSSDCAQTPENAAADDPQLDIAAALQAVCQIATNALEVCQHHVCSDLVRVPMGPNKALDMLGLLTCMVCPYVMRTILQGAICISSRYWCCAYFACLMT